MAKYEVEIKATLKKRVTVEADSEDKAEKQALAKIQIGVINLVFPDDLRTLDVTAKEK